LALVKSTNDGRQIEVKRAPAESREDFADVCLGFTEEQALAEARRCLRCDLEETED